MILQPYACDPSVSRGRIFFEPAAPTRSAFQRDRDRIVHSTAFRRLVYKTQVFLNHEGDLFRTRLTHSLEVAQLGRSIARTLSLNEDLVEAIALAHDLGHTPFGHAGQDALNSCLKLFTPDSAGFEHNLQSLRVVDWLEERYPAYDGLNLSFETREGILKHCSRRNARRIEQREPHGVAKRFADQSDASAPQLQPSLEAQLANLADEIAYNAHDIDDGVRSGLLTMEQLHEVELFREHSENALREYPQLKGRRWLFETIRLMLSAQVYDVIAASRAALISMKPASVQDVRCLPPIICFSSDMAKKSGVMKQFLFRNLYRHPQVTQKTDTARQVISDLFDVFIADPQQLLTEHYGRYARYSGSNESASRPVKPERVVADYIAGMTDRFAAKEHERLMGAQLFA